MAILIGLALFFDEVGTAAIAWPPPQSRPGPGTRSRTYPRAVYIRIPSEKMIEAMIVRTLLRRVRGIVGMGLTWSVVWAVAGAIMTGIARRHDLRRANYLPEVVFTDVVLASAFSWAIYGFALGSLLASVLAITERRHNLEQLAAWRGAAWGGTRGIVGMVLTCSVVWALFGATITVTAWLPDLDWANFFTEILASGFSWAIYGFALGSIFASVLAITERRHTLEQLAAWRVAVWGGTAGALLPLTFIVVLRLFPEVYLIGNNAFDPLRYGLIATLSARLWITTAVTSMLLGAACAATSLALARAGPAVTRRAGDTLGGGEFTALPATEAPPADRPTRP